MPNPSTVGGSGVGTEVLRRTYIDGAGETETTLCTGIDNHIMTILSIIIMENDGTGDSQFDMYIDYDLGGTNLYLLKNVPLGDYKTYVWNEKIILTDTDKLHFLGHSAASTSVHDCWVSYIDQEFTT